MSPRDLMTWGLKTFAIVALVAAVAAAWNARVAVSLAAGGAWNLISLWCLMQLLGAWVGPQPSRRRAIGWLLLKFPLLYLLAWLIIRSPSISLGGFAAGFTISLSVLLAGYLRRLNRPALDRAHGR